jgi:UDP-N-acetylmuramoylalanine--D-glutamate ligase
MRISALPPGKIGLLGFGVEGKATLAALRRAGRADDVAVYSDAPLALEPGLDLRVGPTARLDDLALLLRSPGFAPHHPLRRRADAEGILQSTATRLFLAEVRALGLPIIGVTGSKGKSTTSTLTALTLQAAGQEAALVGNIGTPALDRLDEIAARRAPVVMELSSYQCDDLQPGEGPDIAVLLDLFPEHMDWHGGVEAYFAAKLRLAAAQSPSGRLRYHHRVSHHIVGAGFPGEAEAVNHPGGLHFAEGWFREGDRRLCTDEGMALPGAHNRENAVHAFSAARLLGATPDHLQAALRTFGGLPFRLQDEGLHRGRRWINDSISTAPEAAAAALRAFPQATTLIAGGHDRGYDPRPLIAALAESAVAELILLPITGASIAAGVREAGLPVRVAEVADLPEAVALAEARSPQGSLVLFSPGAPSYNQYRSFEERGRHLRALLQS